MADVKKTSFCLDMGIKHQADLKGAMPVAQLVPFARSILLRVLLCNLLIRPAIKHACMDLIQRLCGSQTHATGALYTIREIPNNNPAPLDAGAQYAAWGARIISSMLLVGHR